MTPAVIRVAAFLAIVIGGNGLAGAAAAAPASALFAAFRRFCIETSMRSEAVEAAVKQAGGKPIKLDFPSFGIRKLWALQISGVALTVDWSSLVRQQEPGSPADAEERLSCEVSSLSAEDGSIRAALAWAGADLPAPTDGDVRHYFVLEGSSHRPANDARDMNSAKAQGRFFELRVRRYPKSSGLSLTRFRSIASPEADGTSGRR
jgi:hypothetical protein